MTILWEPADSGCRLLRCFGNSPILNVPDMIDGRAVSEIGAYCFSCSRPRFPEKIYKTIFIDIENQETTLESGQAFNQKDFDFSAFGTELDGTFLEEITLPDCAATLHNAAFYNCRKLKKLSVGTAISGIGSDEFMNDSQLEHLIVRGKILKQPVYLLFWSESQKILPFLSVRIPPHHQKVLCSSLNIMNG